MDNSTPEAPEEDPTIEGIEIVDITGGNDNDYDGGEDDDDDYEAEEEDDDDDDSDDENNSDFDPEFVPSNYSRVKAIKHRGK